MTRWPFAKGLHDLGNGCFAYLQPDGSWGWSNAGLITDSGETLLVDTLYDLKLTREMLGAMRRAVPAAKDIGVLVNTHSNADHTFGTKEVQLIEVGPAHTAGDVLIHVPGDRTVFTGDIVFSNGHPPAWAGPISNWIKACDLIMSFDVDVIVPGHGPIVEKSALKGFKEYFEYITREARKRYDAGMGVVDAAWDIDLKPFDGWLDPERIIVNVNTLYKEF